jgi:hypothetical protein
MKSYLRIATATITLLSFSAAQAAGIVAELHLIKGKVLVNSGRGYQSMGAVKAGDKILIGQNSRALLSYPDGCDVPLSSKQVYIVRSKSPCAPTQRIAEAPPMIEEPPLPPIVAAAPAMVERGFSSWGLAGAAILGAGVLGGGAFLLLRKPGSG